MIPTEVVMLRDILLKDPNVTNSEDQATRWATRIIERLYSEGYAIKRDGYALGRINADTHLMRSERR